MLDRNSQQWLEKFEKIANAIASREGCELYDVEVVGSGNARVLTVFIDKPEGIGIEDCSNVARGLNDILDTDTAKELVPGGAYSLDVSSPGLDRHLRTKRHFEKVVGKKIYVQLNQNLGSLGAEEKAIQLMKKFEDVLKAVEDDLLVFDIQISNAKTETVKVPLKAVDKARLTFEMKQNPKGPNKKK